RQDRNRLAGLYQIGSVPLPAAQQCLEQPIVGLQVGQLVDPRHRKLVPNIERGSAPVQTQVHPVEGTARIHHAAEQFIGGIINVVGQCVVCTQHEAAGKAPVEID